MPDGPRLLIAAALGRIIEPVLYQALGDDATVRIAEDKAAVQSAVSERLRFDVVVADLTWNDYEVEYSFDGLDVLNILRHSNRQAPVIFAAQGHGIERDHLDDVPVTTDHKVRGRACNGVFEPRHCFLGCERSGVVHDEQELFDATPMVG